MGAILAGSIVQWLKQIRDRCFKDAARQRVIKIGSAYFRPISGISPEEARAAGKPEAWEMIHLAFADHMYEQISSLACLDQFAGTALGAVPTDLHLGQVRAAGHKYAESLMKDCAGLLDDLEAPQPM